MHPWCQSVRVARAADQIRRLLVGHEEKSGAGSHLTDSACDLEAVQRGQAHIEHHDIRLQRLRLMDGVELSFNTSKHHPSVEALLSLREAAQAAFARESENGRDED